MNKAEEVPEDMAIQVQQALSRLITHIEQEMEKAKN
jgi:hypothetical protein